MFDFFQIINFSSKKINRDYSFYKNRFYKEIKGFQVQQEFKFSRLSFLEKNSAEKNFKKSGADNYYIFGIAYSNKNYEGLTGIHPKKLNAIDLSLLYKKFQDDVVNYIKGSFVIVIYNEVQNNVKIITDRLNVLPLYYSLKNNILVISSSVRMILESEIATNEINEQSLTEQLIFEYILGEKTFYKDISQFGPGKIYYFSSTNKLEIEYWDVEKLYHEKLLPKDDSLELLSNQLFENVNLYASDRNKILLSLTGGFDGRTNLAMLNMSRDNFLCYSYGIPGSQQIEIPKNIAQKTNIEYQPIYLDEDFEKNYNNNALEAIEYSNGTAPIMRANYPYAYKKLQNYSDVIVTGLFGSEILRPIYNLGIQINSHSEKLFLSQDVEKSISQSIDEIKSKNYVKPHILNNSRDAIIEYFKKNYFKKYKDYDYLTRFFLFSIKEGIRKYFMQEIQIERPFVSTRFPYFDDDLIDLIYRTPFAGMYNGFLGKSKSKRRKGQLLYAYIIKKYQPELGKIKVDRGYTPNDLLKPFPFNYVKIAMGIWQKNKYINKTGNDTFNSAKWTEPFIRKALNTIKENNNYLDDGIINSFNNKSYLKDLFSYSYLISLGLYNNNYYKLK